MRGVLLRVIKHVSQKNQSICVSNMSFFKCEMSQRLKMNKIPGEPRQVYDVKFLSHVVSVMGSLMVRVSHGKGLSR